MKHGHPCFFILEISLEYCDSRSRNIKGKTEYGATSAYNEKEVFK